MDVDVSNHGSLCILTGLTPEGVAWMDEHLPEDALMWAGGVVVEPRYVEDILAGMLEDGLTVEGV